MALCPSCGDALEPAHDCSNREPTRTSPQRPSHPRRIEHDFESGEALGRQYKVVRKIGEGGMGTVYEVEHVRLGRRFAAKLLKNDIAADRNWVERFEREAKAATRIDHHGIVEVINLDETDDGRVFLIQELLEGRDLAQEVRAGPLPLDDVLEIVSQVAAALDAAHRAGIVHRDLKPGNVFITRRNGALAVKVLDFGISKLIAGGGAQKLTETGAVLGTPAYMSPEQAQGSSKLDGRSDVYSLGAILFEMLTGDPPFRAESPMIVMFQHVTKSAEFPESSTAPAPLRKIALRALAKKPEDRWPSMAAFADAIATGRAEGSAAAMATPMDLPSTPDELQAPRRTVPYIALVMIAFLGLVAALLLPSLEQEPEITPLSTPEPPPVAPSPLVAPRRVRIRIDTKPPGAEVSIFDANRKTHAVRAGGELELEHSTAPLIVEAKLSGHSVARKSITPDSDQSITLVLTPEKSKLKSFRTER